MEQINKEKYIIIKEAKEKIIEAKFEILKLENTIKNKTRRL
jgi:hypothetical protein